MAVLDLRYTDARSNKPPNPFWLKSAALTVDANGTEAILFSFPATKGIVTFVYGAMFYLTEAFDGTPTINVGLGTIATDAITTGGAIAVVDVDELLATAEITVGTPGLYHPVETDLVGFVAGGSPLVITHAATTVPIVYADYDATEPTTGIGYVYMLISTIYE